MTIRPLSHLLQDLRTSLTGDDVSIAEILEALHERGFGIILVLFSGPMAIPAPKPPGLSTFFGIPLIFLTTQQAIGRHTLWLPGFIRRKTLSVCWLDKTLRRILPLVRRIESFVHPRMEFITQGNFSRLTGFFGLIMSISILLPLPGMNTVPAMGITAMATGVMMRDGLAVLVGAVAGTLWVLVIGTLYIVFGMEGLNAVIAFFK